MAAQPIRLGIIGIGNYSVGVHVPGLRRTGKAEIIAIARRNPRLLELAGKELGVEKTYTDWQELIDQSDLDAVVVSTPNRMHSECTIASLENSKIWSFKFSILI